MQSGKLALVLFATISLLSSTARAEHETASSMVRVEGPTGTRLEEANSDGSWRFVCELPCDAALIRSADHRVWDAPNFHELRIPVRGASRVVHYTRFDVPRAIMVTGAVVAYTGATVAILGLVFRGLQGVGAGLGRADSPPDVTTSQAMMVGGGITFLVGGALVLAAAIAKSARPNVRTAMFTTPLGLRF